MACYGMEMFRQQELDCMAIQDHIKAKKAKVDLYHSKIDFLNRHLTYGNHNGDADKKIIEEILNFSITKTTKKVNKFYMYFEYVERTRGEVVSFEDFIADEDLLRQSTHKLVWENQAFRVIDLFPQTNFLNPGFVGITLPPKKWTPAVDAEKFTK